jgi:hypothetical protein
VAAAPELVELPRRRSPARALVVALRPRQWSKNLLVFAGLVFAAKLARRLRLLRRVLRDLERGLPRQRRARPRGRPAPSGQALAPDRTR